MQDLLFFRDAFNGYLKESLSAKEPLNLYEPIVYIMELGGKRLRPVLTLMATHAFDGDYKKALNAALAIEVFHNFSLVHDDIMDEAPIRRSSPTVHEKWDVNTGILSGDVMLINAYQYFETYENDTFKALIKLFSKTAIEVCEGQQYDMDFEERDDVTEEEYIKMITYKTAVLVAAALKMGAMIAGASLKSQELIYDFGLNLGIAFQLQDDFLDAFGDPDNFGKQVGGDIIENKKTFLYLQSLKMGTQEQVADLVDLFSIKPVQPLDKIKTVKDIYEKSGATEAIKREIEKYTHLAFESLKLLDVPSEKVAPLQEFGLKLMQREV